MCGILKNKQFFGILNAIFIMGSRNFQNTIFGRVVVVDTISGQKSRFSKKARDQKLWAHQCAIFVKIRNFSVYNKCHFYHKFPSLSE